MLNSIDRAELSSRAERKEVSMIRSLRFAALILGATILLLAAALAVGCFSPLGVGGRAKAIAGAQQSRELAPAGLQLQVAALPAAVFQKGSGLGNETTTLTIGVTGYGGTTTSAMPMDVVFAIDSSGSMGTSTVSGNDSTGQRMIAAKLFVDKLNPALDRAAVVSWDERIDFTYPPTLATAPDNPDPNYPNLFTTPPGTALSTTPTLTSDFAALKTAIDGVNAEGNTNLALALVQSCRMLDKSPRPEAMHAIILLTDGQDNASAGWQSMINTWVIYAKTRGYRVYTVGLGIGVNSARLTSMADPTGGTYYPAATAANLTALYDEIYTQIVSSTSPSAVDLVEVTRNYIVDHASFSLAPDSMATNPATGETTITWLNVARYTGNLDDRLSSNESFSVSFTAKSTLAGTNLPVNTVAAVASCLDPNGASQTATLPPAYLTVTGWTPVAIDIKPGSDSNPINLKAHNGVIPVAILSGSGFDALSVDVNTVTFEGAREVHVDKDTGLARRHEEDVNNDGILDLVMHFQVDQTALSSASVAGHLSGMTYGGLHIEGSDTVRVLH
jgi:hypothetical protein